MLCVCGRVCVQDGMGTAETLIGSRFQEYIDKKKKKVKIQFYCFQQELNSGR